MKRYLLFFTAAFGASASIGLLTASCGYECECQPTPPLPAPQPAVSKLKVKSFDAQGNYADLDLEPQQGTVTVTGDRVVIRYRQADVDHTVEYAVVGPRTW